MSGDESESDGIDRIVIQTYDDGYPVDEETRRREHRDAAVVLTMALELGHERLSELGIEVWVQCRDHFICADGVVFDDIGWEGVHGHAFAGLGPGGVRTSSGNFQSVDFTVAEQLAHQRGEAVYVDIAYEDIAYDEEEPPEEAPAPPRVLPHPRDVEAFEERLGDVALTWEQAVAQLRAGVPVARPFRRRGRVVAYRTLTRHARKKLLLADVLAVDWHVVLP